MLFSLLIAASLPVAAAQEPVEAETKPTALTPMERYDAIKAEYDQAYQAFSKAYRAASEAERDDLAAQSPDPEDYVPRFLQLAEAHAATETAASSYLWVAQYSRDETSSSKALDALVADHVDSPSMTNVCGLLMRKYDVGEKYLKDILARSSSTEIQGNACYNLGKYYMSLSDLTLTLSRLPDDKKELYVGYLGGEETFARVAAMDSAELTKKAEACFERIATEYADVETRRGTLGKTAESNLFQIRNLQIGMTAPDIAGEDIFGAGFKLSDYRGKVVVIDFWGNW